MNDFLSDHDAPLREVVATLNASRRKMIGGIIGASVLASPLGVHAACAVIPNETAGPFPGDGTNGPNSLAQTGIVRSDLRADFGTFGSALAPGVPMTVKLQLVNVNNNCALLPGYALYLWHCDAVGNYSLYGSASNHNFLRGVQTADAQGNITFTTQFPGAYAGRWPHMHFEIFRSLADAGSGRSAINTSQLALPDATCREVYATLAATYPGSLSNLNATPLARDGIFSDGSTLQMATISGNIASGFTATLVIGVAAGAGVGVSGATNRKLAVEYFNTALNHYVVISSEAEIAFVDSGGAGATWQRTGVTYPLEVTPSIGSIPVYRFYGSVSPGPNSHFFTVSAQEKDALIALAARTPASEKRWNYEGVGFNAGVVSNGTCPQTLVAPSFSQPVYRLYNNGFPAKDSNHRYVTSQAQVQEMQAKGWTLEGVAFCVLP